MLSGTFLKVCPGEQIICWFDVTNGDAEILDSGDVLFVIDASDCGHHDCYAPVITKHGLTYVRGILLLSHCE